MLSNFKLANFKSIKKEANFDFKKLNLFIGPNNSGKTSALIALAFLLEGMLGSTSLKSKNFDLSNLRDFTFKKKLETDIEFSISLSFTKEKLEKLSVIMEGTSLSQFDFSKFTLKQRIPVDANLSSLIYFSSELFDKNNKLIFGFDETRRKRKDLIPEELKGDISSVSYRGILPMPAGREILDRWSKFVELLEEELRSNFFWLKTPRFVGNFLRKSVASELPESVGSYGELTLDTLARIRDREEYMKTWDKIEEWISKFGFKEEVIPRLESGSAYSLNLRDKDLDLRANIIHMGFGINQLLPIIVQCFYTPLREEAIIFIEQPEIHLHPAMQAEVADLFIDATKMGKQLFIETHSEHILLRLQRRIAEDKISAEDVAIFYFEKGKEGTKVKEIKVDETGRYKEKLPGFFEADFEEAVKHMEAVVTRLKKKAADEK